MKAIKTISINGNAFALPDGMAAKDIQALAGFLCTLTALGNEYNYDTSEYVYYISEGVRIQVSDSEIMDKVEARALGDASRARYQAKRDAEAAAS
jgi:hypothetical protein